jgi:S-adenosylmethionine:diacylglycerol 3-amino-3-carboxypropyl transferase
MTPPAKGRPRHLTGPGVRVSAWIEAQDFDRLTQLAADRVDGSVSGVLRDLAHKAAQDFPPKK